MIEHTACGLLTSLAGLEPDEMDRILADGATLPAAFYTSDEIARLEDDAIWRRSWQIVGVEPELRKVGDYVTTHISGTYFDVPVVIVRDEEMNLRAFVNVCRHRAHSVATGTGNRKTLQCPYHGWTYRLNGCLRAVPRQQEGGLPAFETLGLHPLAIDTWAGYIFVALDPQDSLEDAIGEFPQVLEAQKFAFPFAPENVDPTWEYVREERGFGLGVSGCNWKAMNENNIECYHCPTTHTHTFAEMYRIDTTNYRPREFDRGVYHTSYFKDAVAERMGLKERTETPEFQFYYLWPNMYLDGGLRARIRTGFARLRPDGVHASATGGVQYALPGSDELVKDPEFEAEFEDYLLLTGEEDRLAAESVQTGLRSGMYQWGYTLPVSESNTRHFYKLVWDALAPAFR